MFKKLFLLLAVFTSTLIFASDETISGTIETETPAKPKNTLYIKTFNNQTLKLVGDDEYIVKLCSELNKNVTIKGYNNGAIFEVHEIVALNVVQNNKSPDASSSSKVEQAESANKSEANKEPEAEKPVEKKDPWKIIRNAI